MTSQAFNRLPPANVSGQQELESIRLALLAWNPTPTLNLYRRPDGVSLYRRPDGTSLYLRPS